MESCSLLTLAIKNDLPTYNKKNNSLNSPKKNITSNDINIHEYSLNKNFIDPNCGSPPNFFMDKLQNRMKNYYECKSN
jgi:5'-3' exonuclease